MPWQPPADDPEAAALLRTGVFYRVYEPDGHALTKEQARVRFRDKFGYDCDVCVWQQGRLWCGPIHQEGQS